MSAIRLTTAQALVRSLAAQRTRDSGEVVPLFAGVWAIFGHGNVAALGDALHEVSATLPTFRAHNEQSMAHAAIAFSKSRRRRRVMACTTSIGPGATNLVTAASLAYINRLPLLLLPGDVFASRAPDPVLQQLERFDDGTVSVNDCLKPVSRYFDRIYRPEQLIHALDRTYQVLIDPVMCGPVTLALCQDVQAEAHDFPAAMFEERIWVPRRPEPDLDELRAAATLLRDAERPLVIAGGGVFYAGAENALSEFCEACRIPVVETQAGKSSISGYSDLNLGGIGVTGTAAANEIAARADVILAIGTRLQDFTTGSRCLFRDPSIRIIGLNINAFDAAKHRSISLVADAQAGLVALGAALAGWRASESWTLEAKQRHREWIHEVAPYIAEGHAESVSDAQVIGAVQRFATHRDIVVAAAGSIPGELHKLWRASAPGTYHVEYGYSCMGYEIAGGLGVKMAHPDREVIVLVGDGSYLMMNSELATSVAQNHKLIIVLLNNRGFGCISRLQRSMGGASFNNLLDRARGREARQIDFVRHAASLGADAECADNISALEEALIRARKSTYTSVIVINTDPDTATDIGGCWWDVAVPARSVREEVRDAYANYVDRKKHQGQY